MFRYQQLIDIAIANKCSKFIEIGTHNGNTAKHLLKAGSLVSEYVEYVGYDLFEDFTPELGKVEFHGKVPPKTREEVYLELLEYAKKENINCDIRLVKGKTSDTFWNTDSTYLFDLCFVDGGHSLETVEGDITEAIKKARIVVADDFYPDDDKVGCKRFIASTTREDFYLMPVVDIFDGLKIAMAVHPTQAYKWSRYVPLLQDIRNNPPKNLITNLEDGVFIRHIEMLSKLLKFEITNDPSKDLDYAIIQFEGATKEQAQETYDLIKHAKRIALDGVIGDDHRGIGVELLKADNRNPCFPITTDEKDGEKLTIALWPMVNHDVTLNVKTRNCVPDEDIAKNVEGNTRRIKKWVVPCEPHDKTCILVSAGPSLKDEETLVKLKELYLDKNNYFVCVKHAHDYLIEHGIIPFGCMLLDPRAHVKDFVENPHKDVNYFVATMCHTSTLDALFGKANVIGYNAKVNASLETFKKFWTDDTMLLIPGGSSSASRGIAVLQCLGFRKFECFAFDSCFREKPSEILKTHQGLDKTVNVELGGKKYWTDLEYIAQVDDLKNIYKTIDHSKLNSWSDVTLNFHGEGMGQHAMNITGRLKFNYKLDDVIRGIDVRSNVTSRTTEPSFKIIS